MYPHHSYYLPHTFHSLFFSKSFIAQFLNLHRTISKSSSHNHDQPTISRTHRPGMGRA
jgi:hypothetical protein